MQRIQQAAGNIPAHLSTIHYETELPVPPHPKGPRLDRDLGTWEGCAALGNMAILHVTEAVVQTKYVELHKSAHVNCNGSTHL